MTSHQVKQWLTAYPNFRERKNRNKYLGALILKEYGINIKEIPQLYNNIGDIVADLESASRSWRKILEENPDLQGSDYGQGEKLSQEYQLGLGYTPNYHEDVKKLNAVIQPEETKEWRTRPVA